MQFGVINKFKGPLNPKTPDVKAIYASTSGLNKVVQFLP